VFSGFGAGGFGGNDIAAFIGLEGISQFQTDLNKIDGSVKNLDSKFAGLRGSLSDIDSKFAELHKSLEDLNSESIDVQNSFSGLINILAAGFILTAGFVIKKSIDMASQFESLRVELGILYGSVYEGNRIFEKFSQLATQIPKFSFQNIVEAGSILKNFGLDAEKTLKMTADLALFMRVDIVEAAQALGKAFTGGAKEADIFADRGVLNLIKMETGIRNFKEITLEEFRQAMFKTFTDPTVGIIGATDKLNNTFQGAMNNMGDALDQFKNKLVGSNLSEMTIIFRNLIEILTFINNTKFNLDNINSVIEKLFPIIYFSQLFLDVSKKIIDVLGEWTGKQNNLNVVLLDAIDLMYKFGVASHAVPEKIVVPIIPNVSEFLDTSKQLEKVWEHLQAELFRPPRPDFDKFLDKLIQLGVLEPFAEEWQDIIDNLQEIKIDPEELRISDAMAEWSNLGLTVENVNGMMMNGVRNLSRGIVSAMFDTKTKLGPIFKGMAMDFLSLFVEELLRIIAIKLVPKILELLAIFDVYSNDMMAQRVGRHYAENFTKGTLKVLNQNFIPSILNNLSPQNIDTLPISAVSEDGSIARLKVEVETVPIEDARARAYFIRQNRNVIMPDQDYINTFLRTKKGEFDK